MGGYGDWGRDVGVIWGPGLGSFWVQIWVLGVLFHTEVFGATPNPHSGLRESL